MNASVVEIADPRTDWAASFRCEAERIGSALAPFDVCIEHIGSTSVAGLPAKPFVDIIVGTRIHPDLQRVTSMLADLGYALEGARPEHHWLCWPHPDAREFVVHVVLRDGVVWNARTAFRDSLRASRSLRARYAELKRELAAAHPSDLTAYTHGKRAFVEEALAAAGVRPERSRVREEPTGS